MPFRARCMFCQHGVRVPDHAVGASAKCPKCGSFFTVVPLDEDAGLPTTGTTAPQPSPSAPPIPAATAMATMPALPALPDPLPPAEWPSPWLDPLGVLALLLGGAALLCVSVYVLGAMVRPLAALGLVAALVGVVVALLADRPRPYVALAGALVNAAVLWLAFFLPRWLGPTYLASREAAVDDPTIIRVVALPNLPPRGEAVGPDGVEADKAALQQGKLRVQVVSAVIAPIELQATPRKKLSKEAYLTIRFRAQQSSGMRAFAADPYTAVQPAGPPRPTLTDNLGKKYAEQRPAGEGGMHRPSGVFPVDVADELWVFEAPGPQVDRLILEVPASAWGGPGVFRFLLPRSMFNPSPMPVPAY